MEVQFIWRRWVREEKPCTIIWCNSRSHSYSSGLGLDVAFHSLGSERVKGKGWVAPYKFLKSDGTKAHIGNETQTYGAI